MTLFFFSIFWKKRLKSRSAPEKVPKKSWLYLKVLFFSPITTYFSTKSRRQNFVVHPLDICLELFLEHLAVLINTLINRWKSLTTHNSVSSLGNKVNNTRIHPWLSTQLYFRFDTQKTQLTYQPTTKTTEPFCTASKRREQNLFQIVLKETNILHMKFPPPVQIE